MDASSPILEYDPTPEAILMPRPPRLSVETPQYCVLTFFKDVLAELADTGRLEPVGAQNSEIGPHPLYRLMTEDGRAILVGHAGLGGPLSAGLLEELIALGIRRFMVCGGCGVLDASRAVGHPVILTGAVRDEGTSYHYLPPSREVAAHPQAVAALEAACRDRGIEYSLGKSWCTDAIYRKTRERGERRLQDGCVVVEMESAALFAVARFRGIVLGEVVYSGDVVVPEAWDGREWVSRKDIRSFMFWLAVDACLRLN